VFLGSKESKDTHNGSSALYSFNWNTFLDSLKQTSFSETKTLSSEQLLDITTRVMTEIIPSDVHLSSLGGNVVTVGGYPFPGLYCASFPSRPFINKSVLLLETQWRSHGVILSVNIDTKEIQTLHNNEAPFSLSTPFHVSSSSSHEVGEGTRTSGAQQRSGSWLTPCEPSSSILDVHPLYGLLLLTSTPTNPPVLVHLNLSSLPSLQQAQSKAFPFLSNMTTKAASGSAHSPLSSREGMSCYILHTPCDGQLTTDDFESIVILPPRLPSSEDSSVPSPSSLPPLLVVPHGGPHSAFTTAYVSQYSDYLSLIGGYALLLVNYRGSTGYGQFQLDSLPGQIGTNDVQDVYQATQAILSLEPPLVSPKCAIFGGSHGGFLTAHMIGQYPQLYAAAALRNPVINIPAMFTTSDIPDWCVVEACGLGSYDFQRYQLPSEKQFHQMTLSSPIRSLIFLPAHPLDLSPFHIQALSVLPCVYPLLSLLLDLCLCLFFNSFFFVIDMSPPRWHQSFYALVPKIKESHGVKACNIIML
jgi:pimeloyl-ACP methyl ester carboxylesterase